MRRKSARRTSRMTIERAGVAVAEVFRGKYELSELSEVDKLRWKRNPEAVIAALLRREGFKVRRVIVSRASLAETDGGCRWQQFHVVHPPEEYSKWIWQCV